MPSNHCVSVSRPLFSSTLITPSLPNLRIAFSDLDGPISCFAIGGDVPTVPPSALSAHVGAAACLIASTTRLVCQIDLPRFRSIGFMPAGYSFQAFFDDGLGPVQSAVVVPSPAFIICAGSNFLHHLARPCFSKLVFKFDVFGKPYTVFVVIAPGGQTDLSRHHVAAFSGERYLTASAKNIHASQHADAGVVRKLGRL